MAEDLSPDYIHAIITDPPYCMNIMNLSWDKVLPPFEIWEACFTALRPGGFCLVFGHARLYHRMACMLEDCGFIIKDCLCWSYASGFPKSLDIGRSLKNDDWKGWGTQLKTAWEPIIMAQKPLSGTYIENIKTYNVGALNIDDCRVPYASDEDRKSLESFMNFAGNDHGDAKYFSANTGAKKQVNIHPDGRWPANLLWLDPMFADYDHIFMVPKPTIREKRKYNTHPTVKPIRLLERLITLVTPKPSIVGTDVNVLDPFMGSASTGVACKNLGRRFVGYELDQDNFGIAAKRLSEKIGHIDIFER